MKKIVSLALALVLVLSLTACGGKDGGKDSEKSEPQLRDWWDGDWYGWWQMTGCSGYYEEMEGEWWDICGNIDIGADKTGTVRLWDEDYSRDSLMAKVNVTLSASGTGEHGTMTSEDGQFTDIAIEHADWIVDPGLTDQDDLICIDGWYENGDDEFYYEIYLRPWGVYWDDVDEDSLPKSYDDWYLPLIKAGKSMPNAIGADAPASSGDTKSTAPSGNSNAPGGTGLVSEEAVQKGYVWMNEVNIWTPATSSSHARKKESPCGRIPCRSISSLWRSPSSSPLQSALC